MRTRRDGGVVRAAAAAAAASVLGALASGCTLARLDAQAQAYYESTVFVGRVDCARPCTAPIRVAALRAEAPPDAEPEHEVLLHEAGGYELIVRRGDYRLLAYADDNGNRRPDAGEPWAQLGVPMPVGASGTGVVAALDMVLAPAAEAPPRMAPAGARHSTQAGAVRSLDDPVLSAEAGRRGYWSPMDAFKADGGNIHFLEPYDPHRTPVLFVHGAAGSAQDWRAAVATLDRTRFQAWLYQYPSGAAVRSMAYLLYWKLLNLQLRHRHESLVIVAHSMGGLVARTLLADHGAELPQVRLLVTLSTPWGGEPGADLGVTYSPAVVPSWRDMQPDGPFLQTLFTRPLPPQLEHVLYFGHRGGYSLLRPNHDGAVTLASQLRMPAQAGARLVLGFDEDHTSILSSPQVLAQLRTLLAGHGPRGDQGGRVAVSYARSDGLGLPGGTAMLLLQPLDDAARGEAPMAVALRSVTGEDAAGPVAPGRYRASLVVAGFAATPQATDITVGPQASARLAYTLQAQGTLAGYIGDDGDSVARPAGSWRPPHPSIRIRSVSVEGAGVSRRLEPATGGLDELLSRYVRGEDYARGAMFSFVALPQGRYRLTIVADGYESYHAWHDVVPGRPAPYTPIVLQRRRGASDPG